MKIDKLSKHFLVTELVPPGVAFKELAQRLQDNAQTLVEHLESLRKLLGCPVYINTYPFGFEMPRIGAGYRDLELNARVGGVWNSLHMDFLAADLVCKSKSLYAIEEIAKVVGFTEIIRYPDRNFVHCGLEHLRE